MPLALLRPRSGISAQIVRNSNPSFRGGFNANGAEQNKQFILNLLQWLAGILPE